MKTFVLNMPIDKYLYQNRAEIVDGFDGCLLDNYLAYSDKAIMAIYEEYVNTWTSRQRVYYARIGTDDAMEIENKFYERMNEQEENIA